MPAHLIQVNPQWRAAEVMSHVPPDRGVLLLEGENDERVVQGLRVGLGPDASFADVPWSAWRPVIVRWGGLAVLLGLASICLAVVVHPQWSRHERLAYPIVRFFEQVVPPEAGRPRFDRLFFWGMGITLSLHLLNGLAATTASPVSIPMSYSLRPLMELFPNAARAGGSELLFQITLIPSVIAFCWFVQTKVTLSIGLSNFFWVALGAVMIARGEPMPSGAEGGGQAMLSLGACLGVAVIVGYVGRRHYLAVLGRMVGIQVDPQRPPPRSCVWAGRLFTLLLAASVLWLSAAGLHWSLALAFVLLCLLMFLVIARINVETGLIFIQLAFAPATVLLAWCGFESIGPTATLVMMIANVMLLSDPRQVLFAFVANGLRLIDRNGQAVGKAAPLLALVMVASFLVAGAVTLTTQYRLGLDAQDWIATRMQPSLPFDGATREILRARANDTTDLAAAAGGLDWLGGLGHDATPLVWTAAGLILVVGCGLLMLRLPWWPIHPVLFVVWGTLPSMWFGWSFLIGWLIKDRVVKHGGTKMYKNLTPLMVGLIAGEMLAALGWIAFGWVYYHATGTVPPAYSILPG